MKGLCLKLSSLIPPAAAAAATHASLLSDAASAAVSSNPGNKQVKATSTSRPRFLAPCASHGGSEPVRSPRTIHSLLYRARKRNELTESESLHCIHGLPRQKF